MKDTALQLFFDTLEVEHPLRLIRNAVRFEKNEFSVGGNVLHVKNEQSIYAISVGKAAYPMALGIKESIGIPDAQIRCITPQVKSEHPQVKASSHPIPDEKSLEAVDWLLEFIAGIPSGSTILFAISGGTSALLCKPAEGIFVEDLNALNNRLLKSGASIDEINAVRKHLSAIKGGQLLKYFKPDCTLIDLMISDVPGNNPQVIGSGPTTPDSSIFEDARDVLLKYELWEQAPENVKNHIDKGIAGKIAETIKPGNDPLMRHEWFIIGSPEKFVRKLANTAESVGFKVWVAGEPYNKAVNEVAASIYRRILEEKEIPEKPAALVFYGESTVKVTGKGKGGRNQELALQGAIHIKGMHNVCWLSAGTDGIDGPTDAAGAVVDGCTIEEADRKGLNARDSIRRNDSYRFHEQMGTLLKTGPTGNNVMDVTLVLIR